MIDPDFDPLEDLENCKLAIHELGQAIDAVVTATNAQAAHIKTIEKKVNFQVKRLDALIGLLEEKINGQT